MVQALKVEAEESNSKNSKGRYENVVLFFDI
jgi:hypothetical protein